MDQLNWHGSDAWVRAEEREWVVDGEAAGKVTQAGPLAFVKVYDAVSESGGGGGELCLGACIPVLSCRLCA